MFLNAEQEFTHPNLKMSAVKYLFSPRWISWVCTKNNAAPFSWAMAPFSDPLQIMMASGGSASGTDGDTAYCNDTFTAIRDEKQFVVCGVSFEVWEDMHATSVPAPRGVHELKLPELEIPLAKTAKFGIEYDRRCKWYAECVYTQTVHLLSDTNGKTNSLVVGKVLAIWVDDSVVVDGRVSMHLLDPVLRTGGNDYIRATTGQCYRKKRPLWSDGQLAWPDDIYETGP